MNEDAVRLELARAAAWREASRDLPGGDALRVLPDRFSSDGFVTIDPPFIDAFAAHVADRVARLSGTPRPPSDGRVLWHTPDRSLHHGLMAGESPIFNDANLPGWDT